MKKVIAWICDGPGWAYDARVEAMKKALPGYVHQKVYAVVNTLDHVIAEACKADIIVCMYVRYVDLLRDAVDSSKVIACIGGKRPFEIKLNAGDGKATAQFLHDHKEEIVEMFEKPPPPLRKFATSNLPQPMTEQARVETRRELTEQQSRRDT